MPTLETSNLFAERRAHVGRQILAMTNKRIPLTQEDLATFEGFTAELRGIEKSIRKDNEAKYARAFRRWLRYGLQPTPHQPEFPAPGSARDQIYDLGVSQEEREILELSQRTREREFRDMGVVAAGVLQSAYPGATAGFFCPEDFAATVENAMKSFSCMLETSTPFETKTGSVLAYPTSNDTSTIGEQIDEAEQVTSQDPETDQIDFRSYKYSSKLVKVSLELLLDSGVDLDNYFATIFGWRIGRILNQKFTTGVGGTAEPNGILNSLANTYTVNPGDGGLVQAIGAAENSGVAQGPNSVGTTDLANLELALDPAYRGPGCAFMMSPSTLASLRSQLDKEGRVLFPELHAGGQDRLLNYPVKLNVNMPSLQTQASSPPVTVTSILFGQFSKYIWRKAGPYLMYRLRDRFAEYGQRAFLLICRADGQLLDAGSHPVVGLTNTY
jgi:HK97 family phage major capsid protein